MTVKDFLSTAAFAWSLALVPAHADRGMYEPPQVDHGRGAFNKLTPRKHEERLVVSIYEFRSNLSEIPARATTDLFKTALVRSGRFRVVERARLAEGVARERQLASESTGAAIDTPLRNAKYLFEGSISEASPNERQRTQRLAIAGMEIGGGSNRDVIAIDVRVVEVATGDIVDVVSVRKSVVTRSSSVAGVGAAIGAVMAQRGRSVPYVPDLAVQDQTRESLDAALRDAIELAVAELAARLAP